MSNPTTPSKLQNFKKTPKGTKPDFRKSKAMVTIKVSLYEAEDTFVVHKNFICFYSPYFKAAFNGSFEEGESKTLNLEDASPGAFAIFVNWLYTQRIEEPNSDKLHMSGLLELWLLADRILLPRLQNEALASLNKARFESYSGRKFKRVYDNTPEGSPLREYLVSLAGTKCGPNIKHPEFYPHEMLVDVVNYWRKEKRTQASPKWVSYSEEELVKFYVDERGTAESGLREVGSKPEDASTLSNATKMP